jgi:hypothetical protein
VTRVLERQIVETRMIMVERPLSETKRGQAPPYRQATRGRPAAPARAAPWPAPPTRVAPRPAPPRPARRLLVAPQPVGPS